MKSSSEAQAASRAQNPGQAWMAFFKLNCAALFQTALLLCADPDKAEESVADTLGKTDRSKVPAPDELGRLQKQLARRAVQMTASVSPVNEMAKAQAMLQKGLRPVLQMESSSRICFVLRLLLGYTTSSCAQMLGVEECAVKELLRMAILQLHHVVSENNSLHNRV